MGMPNLKDQLAECRKLGWKIRFDGGEAVVSLPSGKTARVNVRRKDGRMVLEQELRKHRGKR